MYNKRNTVFHQKGASYRSHDRRLVKWLFRKVLLYWYNAQVCESMRRCMCSTFFDPGIGLGNF
jgi:hypothetical protein